jgi:hypothetical protein
MDKTSMTLGHTQRNFITEIKNKSASPNTRRSKQEEQSMAYLRVSPGNGGNSDIKSKVRCMGEERFKNGAKAEGEDKTARDKQ